MMALCAVSCDKDRTGSGSSANKLVKEISYSDGYDDYRVSFEYDNENRLSKVVKSDGSGIHTMTYTYEEDTITEVSGDDDGEQLKYHINNEGFLTKIEVKTDSYNTLDRTGIYYYLYEYENGLLKACKTENLFSIVKVEYEWENGDIIMEKNLSVNYNRKYEYTNFENNLNNKAFAFDHSGNEYLDFIGSEYLDFIGISSRHLPKTNTFEYSFDTYIITDYSYEFDADGCVTKIIMTDRDDSSYREEYNIIYY